MHTTTRPAALAADPDAGEPALADDILRGAGAIAEFILGDAEQRRTIYHLADSGHLPVFRLGAVICARKSKLRGWIEAQENTAIDKA